MKDYGVTEQALLLAALPSILPFANWITNGDYHSDRVPLSCMFLWTLIPMILWFVLLTKVTPAISVVFEV